LGLNVAILNYNIIKFYKFFQFNLKIIIRKNFKFKFFKKRKKFKKKLFSEILKFSEVKNFFKLSKKKIKKKKKKE